MSITEMSESSELKRNDKFSNEDNVLIIEVTKNLLNKDTCQNM